MQSVFLSKYLVAQLNAKPDSRASLRILADLLLHKQKAGDKRKTGKTGQGIDLCILYPTDQTSEYRNILFEREFESCEQIDKHSAIIVLASRILHARYKTYFGLISIVIFFFFVCLSIIYFLCKSRSRDRRNRVHIHT